MSFWKRLLFRLAGIWAGIMLAFIVGECVFRALKIHHAAFKGYQVDWVQWDGFYTYPPNASFRFQDETGGQADFLTDRWGLRNSNDVYTKTPIVPRILVLGDSFVEAASTPYSKTLCYSLQEMFGPRGTVINGGIGGYGNYQSLMLLNYLHPKIQPAAVVLMVYLGNDLLDNYGISEDRLNQLAQAEANVRGESSANRADGIPIGQKLRNQTRSLVGKSHLLTFIKSVYKAIKMPIYMAYFNFELETFRNNRKEFVKQAIRNTRRILSSYKRYAEQNRVPVYVFLIPSKAQLYEEFCLISGVEIRRENLDYALDLLRDPAGYSFHNPALIYQELCNQIGLNCYDLSPVFAEHKAEDLFFKVDTHWTARGQLVAAGFIKPVLDRDSVYVP